MVNALGGAAFIWRNATTLRPIRTEPIEPRILDMRDQRVLLDADFAELYGVPTKVLLQAVKRNIARFPSDFMFQIRDQEVAILRSQIVTSSSTRFRGWGGRRSAPYAFTEQGVAMLSSVLRSARAIAMNVVRAFVRLREMVAANAELAKKLDELEQRVAGHDQTIASIVRAIRDLATPPEPTPKRRIGFISED